MVLTLPINKAPANTRVVVAMSGGVDSSTVAGLMVEAGYEVVGITLQLYDHGAALQKKGACCAGQDIYDARQVANRLGIAHYVLNYENVFKQDVIEEFADSYIRGETPIPCVRCNQSVKFRDLLAVAKDLNADALVTGHYIQRKESDQGPHLFRGVDSNKDQSYFLFATTPEQLSYLHFPLGDMHKDQTRAHAERFGLAVADKPESQDICFVPGGNYAKVIERLRPEAYSPGEVVHMDGRVMGTHDGIANFTVGQGKGLGLGHHEKLYVIKIDPTHNQVIVGPKEALGITTLYLTDINWLGNSPLDDNGVELQVKLRSTQSPAPATLYANGTVQLHTADNAVAPGQACVFYDGERVLGGGWITRKHQDNLALAA